MAETLQPTPADISSWQYLRQRAAFIRRAAILEMAVRNSYRVPGHIIEFGVAEGGSTRVIRRVASQVEKGIPATRHKRIYACDSFKGLPEKYENADVGTFATTPPNIRGVRIVEGYFDDTLTTELANEVGVVAFASLDADLYSSTLTALNWLTPLLRTGSLLLFDEFLGENESEKRAFEKWSRDTGYGSILIGEFMREPSGWGATIDRRALFQVIREENLPPAPPKHEGYLRRQIRKHPALYDAARSIYRRFG